MKKLVCVVGHFGMGKILSNGQTIKTKIISNELEKNLGTTQVDKVDTHGGIKILPKIMINLINEFRICSNIIILPAHNGIKIIVPLCAILNNIFRRRLHYIVIGGWLPEFLENKRYLVKYLKKFDYIYVETNTMKKALEKKD